MDAGGEDRPDESIGDLVGRLVEDGRSYAEAELALIKAIAQYRAQRAGRALAMLAAAGYFLIRLGTAGLKGLARDEAEQQAIDRGGAR